MAASTITNFKRFAGGNQDFFFSFQYTGPSNYASGGDNWTIAAFKAVAEGISHVDFLVASPFCKSDFSQQTEAAFQPINDGTNVGKFRIYNAVDPHNHNLLLTGSQGAGQAVQVTPDSNSGILGKTSAGNDTLTGGVSNILTNTASNSAAENTGPTDYSTFSCWFFGKGQM